jgi:hypothetical protein
MQTRRADLFTHAQTVALAAMFIAAKLHAHPAERLYLILPFFLGAAEIASGASGL